MQSRIGTRLRQVVDAKGASIKKFAELTGLPYRTVQDYLHDKRAPGVDAIACIGARAGVNLNWLVNGEGPMWRCEPVVSEPSSGSRPLESTIDDVTSRVAKEIRLGEIALVARRGSQTNAWRILQALSGGPKEGLTVAEIRDTLAREGKPCSDEDLVSGLAYLRKSNLAMDVDGASRQQRVRLVTGQWELRAADHADAAELIMTVMRELSRCFFAPPEKQRLRSLLGLATARVPRDEGVKLLRKMLREAKITWEDEVRQAGPEHVSFFMGGWAAAGKD